MTELNKTLLGLNGEVRGINVSISRIVIRDLVRGFASIKDAI